MYAFYSLKHKMYIYYYFPFTNEEIEIQRLSPLSKVTSKDREEMSQREAQTILFLKGQTTLPSGSFPGSEGPIYCFTFLPDG